MLPSNLLENDRIQFRAVWGLGCPGRGRNIGWRDLV